MAKSDNTYTCCICGKVFVGYGNNPYPVSKDENARCCDQCNREAVIPARLREAFNTRLREAFKEKRLSSDSRDFV